jgi:arsenate reductase (glutaredoxin)
VRRLTVYTLKNCDTCRRAVKWLRGAGWTFEERPIREHPPGTTELRAMLAANGELRRLFNTSGRDYRTLRLGDRLPAMSEDEAIKLLAGNGSLVKRPFLIGPGVALVGFDEKTWAAALA